ncbi:protein TASOR isoform X2 [Hemicordylus capensis]|uniref:protein TASOR isoform X2 n=1 Tax=Hemicordylus capensis TaxID=884348 RepID=UPI002302BE5F|nr:protein TASOR isoform X2 [Hemicordylus capensis]
MSEGEKVPEQPPRRGENGSSGLSAVEKKAAAAEAEDPTQNGGAGSERSWSEEERLLLGLGIAAASAAEGRGSPSNGHRKSSASAAHEQPHPQPQSDGLRASLSKAAEDLPVKRNFQIPKKSKEKKALFQPITTGSRDFDDIINILHSAYLDSPSKDHFTYKTASYVHSELLEKEFTEKQRELKRDGRTEKELAETYAFLMVDRALVQSICENGLQVGHSNLTTLGCLGNSSMGVYLSRYSDLLQVNALEARATGDIIIFKVIKGKMKSIYDNLGVKPTDSTVKSTLDPAPKHECHVFKNANKVSSIYSYRAYERTQYYFYEYSFDEIRLRPRHVYPYAVVSFSYKDEKIQKYLPQSRSKMSNLDKTSEKPTYMLWKGQLLNRGMLVCHAALKSETRPLLPCKLPEKLDVEMVLSIEHLTKKISPKMLYKETYSGEREEYKNGMYCSLYEVVEKTRSGSNLEGLLQKLEREKLVIVKPLVDKGYLLLLSSRQMASPHEIPAGRPSSLQALFLFQHPRSIVSSTHKNEQKNASRSIQQETHVVMPEFTKFIQSLHYAYNHSRKDPKSDLNTAVEKYISQYLKDYSKYKEFFLYPYKSSLDDKRFLYIAPKNKSNFDSALRAYIFGSEAYQIPVSKAKKIMEGNRKSQQFSPVSDYEAPEEESDYMKRKAGKRNGSKCETLASKRKPFHPGDYDKESINKLIDLIQCKKQNVDRESDTEDNRNKSRLKRKLESNREGPQKYLKISDSSESISQNERDRTSESLLSIIADLGGRDTDLRQQNVSDPPIADTSGVLRLISEVLTNPESPLARRINQALAENNSRQAAEYNCIPPQVKEEPELPNIANIENVQLKDPQSPVNLAADASCLPYSVDVSTSEAEIDHMLHFKETSTGSVSSFEGCSNPSTPIEQNSHRQHSSSNNIGSTEIHWKLIPITGLKSPEESLAYSPPKDASENDPRVINRQRSSDYQFPYSAFSDVQKGRLDDGIYTEEEKFEDQGELEAEHSFASKHPISGLIETAILEEYNLFTNKIQEILQQKNIMYVSRISRPVLSAQERVMKLSEYICLQASEIAVQEYIEALSEKLNNVVALSSSHVGIQSAQFPCSPGPADDSVIDTVLNLSLEEPVVVENDFDVEPLPEPLCSSVEENPSINEQNQSVILDIGKEQCPATTSVGMKLIADSDVSTEDPLQQPDKTPRPVDNTTNLTTQPALAGFISQLKPEVFDSFVKIMQDVQRQKNIVKFYIHEEQESMLCKEIKEYLLDLRNTECHPEQFLKKRAEFDKLLIIIQNEDIASLIHKIPCLVDLKKLSCVNFAGVDSLDDVKNHTYNELFVSGGFVVSDESVLTPESVTVDKLNKFLKFLEELSTPDGKWQWKVHCKIQKKLKELGRMNTNAMSLLTLLNTYQKKHMVEILSYHQCDSQTRNPPELDCLIRLQAQNIQQRHIVFLTEKNVSAFETYADNGIVVTTVDYFMHNFKRLVGYHNSVSEENRLPSPIDHERQSVLVENDEKDEEDMSLDSGDETSQIEVCNDASKYGSHLEGFQTETKGSHGTDSKQNSQTGTQLSTEGHNLLTEKTSKINMQDIQPVTPVSTTCSTEGERTNSVEQVPFNNFQVYNRQLSVPHQFSHFNVLTHQTFLGATYPMSAGQNQEGGSYFLTAYSQNMDIDQSSPRNWDVSCDSSRPYSKQN